MTQAMARSRAVSVPGRMGIHCRARARAETVYLGSTEIIFTPAFLAAAR